MAEMLPHTQLRMIFGRLVEESPSVAELFPDLARRAREIRHGLPGTGRAEALREIGADHRFFALLEALLEELPARGGPPSGDPGSFPAEPIEPRTFTGPRS